MFSLKPTALAVIAAILQLVPLASAVAQEHVEADEITIHVAENSASGDIVADVRTLFGADDAEQVLLTSPNDIGFRLDSDGRLSVARNARLDFEADSSRELVFEIVSPRAADPLRERFVATVKENGVADDVIDRLKQQRRTVNVRVVIDDRPEPPHLLADALWMTAPEDAAPGKPLGRVIAVDPDASDQLRYRLLDAHSLLRIDSETGTLFLQERAGLPAITEIPARIEVVDRDGLRDVRTFHVRLNRAPRLPAASKEPIEPVLAANSLSPDGAPMNDATQQPVVAETGHSENTSLEVASASKKPSPVDDETTAGPITLARLASEERFSGHSTQESDNADGLIVGLPTKIVAGLLFVSLLLSAAFWLRRRRRPAGPRQLTTDETALDRGAGLAHPVTPSEIEAVLSKLDQSLRDDSGASVAESPSISGQPDPSATESDPVPNFVGEMMSRVMGAAGLLATEEQGGHTGDTLTATGIESERTVDAVSQSGQAIQPHRRITDVFDTGERDRLEEFRQISRSKNRAEISRHHRERMKDQWMSVGATAAACFVTGSVCLFTSCFGAVSMPCGTVLLSVAAILLMKRSLYPQVPRRRATDAVDV